MPQQKWSHDELATALTLIPPLNGIPVDAIVDIGNDREVEIGLYISRMRARGYAEKPNDKLLSALEDHDEFPELNDKGNWVLPLKDRENADADYVSELRKIRGQKLSTRLAAAVKHWQHRGRVSVPPDTLIALMEEREYKFYSQVIKRKKGDQERCFLTSAGGAVPESATPLRARHGVSVGSFLPERGPNADGAANAAGRGDRPASPVQKTSFGIGSPKKR